MPVIPLVPSDAALPKKTAVAIVGGGVIGVSIALELAERGIDVVLLEKGEIAAEQSSRNWGWCRQMGRDPREIPLVKIALDKWRGMNARVEAETGFRQCGIVYFSQSDAEIAAREKWYAENVPQFGLDTELLSPARTAALLPGATRPFKGGLYTATDGRAEPFLAVPAMAEAARRKGAKIFTHCAVRGFETMAGRVSGIVTEKGTIACDTVVVAGGAWTRRFLGNAGIPFKQLCVLSSVMRSNPLDIGHERTGSGGAFTFRKRLDGGFTITHQHFSVADIVPDSFRLFFDFLPALKIDWSGLKLRLGQRFLDEARLKRQWKLDEVSPFEQVRVLDPAPVDRILDNALESLRAWFPAFAPLTIAERWAGLIDVTPDVVPVLSPVDHVPGLFIASGLSGHGFGIGPGVGQLMAEMVTGEPLCVDPTPFRYSRQIDGAKPRPLSGP